MGHRRPDFGDVEGLVLAGGLSRRFGSDKARAIVDGRPMIQRVIGAMSQVVSPVRISVRSADDVYDDRLEHVVDIFPGCGPLAGLHAGLLACGAPWLLVVATDYPYVLAGDIERLLLERGDSEAAVLSRDSANSVQPLCACYHRSILADLEASLLDGCFGVQEFLESLPQKPRAADIGVDSFRNINSRADL